MANRDGITPRYIRRLVDVAFLSPELVEAILQGRQPVKLTAMRLTELDLPLDRTEQHKRSAARICRGGPGGPQSAGREVQTLVLTDIATGWTEFAPLLVREQRLLTEVPSEIRKLLPFPLGRRREAVLKGAREMKEQGGFTWVRDALPTTDLKAVFGA